MANTYVTVAGIVFHFELPMGAADIWIGTEKRMASGQARRAHVADKRRHGPYRSEEMTQAQRDAAYAALAYSAALTYTDERGISRDVLLVSRRYEIIRSAPDVEGAATGTGTLTYVIELELEDV